MLYNTLHNRWLRLVAAVVGELIAAAALNLFIVPLHLYTGGILGVCQLARTLMQTYLGISFGPYDIAGILYFLSNIPILLLAYKTLGKSLVFKTLICTVAYSLFYSIIPIPSAPIVDDYLTACLLGGILAGVGSGIVLTCGGSGGGLDIVGLCLSKRGSSFTVGKFSLTFTSMVLDRMHQQNISVQVLIFTREDESKLGKFIMENLGRGVTYWRGTGAYTGDDVHVLCVCLSKYEIEELLHAVHTIDPHAFLTVQEGTRVYGNFRRKVE